MSAWGCRSTARALVLVTAAAALTPTAAAGLGAGDGSGLVAGHVSTPVATVIAVAPDTIGGRLSAPRSAEGLPIRSIVVVPRNVYDPVPPGRFGAVYRAADRLHVVSRSATVRQLLVLAPGQRWEEEHGREALRTLRGVDILEPVALDATVRADSVDVILVTHDIWSTVPEFNLERGGGQSYGSVAFTERNLIGFGKSVSVAYHSDPLGVSRSVSWSDPAVGGTHAQLRALASTGSAGVIDQFYAGLPFWSQDAPTTAYATYLRRTLQDRLFDHGQVAAEFDERREEAEFGWGRGGAVDGTVRRLVYSFFLRDRRLGPSRLEPGAPPEFDGIEENLRIRRVAAELTLWRPHFIERRRVDRMTGIEDFDLGTTAAVKLGFAPHALGSTADESYARFALDLGAETPYGFGTARGVMSTRVRFKPEELIRTVDARWVSQPGSAHTLVGAAWGAWGLRAARDWQVIVGGLDGLRAYPVHALTGRRAWRFNAEDRWMLGRDYAQLVDLGVAGFWDCARAWGPGASGTTWLQDVGVGLRLGLPHLSSSQVFRCDVAWPLAGGGESGRAAVFSFGSSQAF